jgi:hypothetical protein
MLVLDALFDHIQRISSHVEIIGSLVQCSPISAIDVRVGSIASFWPWHDHFRSTPTNGHSQGALACLKSANSGLPGDSRSSPRRDPAFRSLKRRQQMRLASV